MQTRSDWLSSMKFPHADFFSITSMIIGDDLHLVHWKFANSCRDSTSVIRNKNQNCPSLLSSAEIWPYKSNQILPVIFQRTFFSSVFSPWSSTPPAAEHSSCCQGPVWQWSTNTYSLLKSTHPSHTKPTSLHYLKWNPKAILSHILWAYVNTQKHYLGFFFNGLLKPC